MNLTAPELFDIFKSTDPDKFQLISTQPSGVSTQPNDLTTQPSLISTQPPFLSEELLLEISELKQKEHDAEKIMHLIIEICSQNPVTAEALAKILNRREDYIRRKYLQQ